jgi:hypothetical protein
LSRLFSPENLPNLCLCIIGTIGIIAALLTLRVIKIQTEATKKSVTLQEAAMKQWLVLQNWSNERRVTPEGVSLLDVGFDIANPTNWPLTLIATVLTVRSQGAERVAMTNHFIPLAPRETHNVAISNIPLDDTQYLEGGRGVVCVLYGYLNYFDCFEKHQEWTFSGSIHCTKKGTTFRKEWFSDHPYRKDQKAEGQQEQEKSAGKAN